MESFNLLSIMQVGLFLLGAATFILGLRILLIDIFGEQNKLLAQANRLAQKGMSEALAGLVGNASILLNTINEMVRTRRGIGVTLLFFGAILMIASFFVGMPACI